MKKLTRSFLAILIIMFSTSVMVTSQYLTKIEKDSIVHAKAEKYFKQAYENKDKLANQERIVLLQKADSIFRSLEDWTFSLASINAMCNIHQLEREYEKIDARSKEAIRILRTHLTEEHPYFGGFLNLRGMALWECKSDYTNAVKLLKESIEIDKNNGASLSNTSIIYFNLAACYQETGDYEQAIDLSQNALRIQLDSFHPEPSLTLNLYNLLGLCYNKTNQFSLAIQNFEAGIKYANIIPTKDREINQVILYLYQNLADLYLKANKISLAQRYISLALDLQKGKAFIKDAYTYELQGKTFLKENKNNSALEAFQKSTRFAQLEYKDFDKHPMIGNTYLQTGNAWLTQNKLDSAFLYYQLALINNSIDFDASNPSQSPPLEDLINPLSAIDIFEGKAKAYTQLWKKKHSQNDLKNAFDNYTLAINAISTTRQSFNAEGSKHTLAEKVISIYEGAIETTFKLYEVSQEIKWLEAGFQFAEGNKAAALFDAIQNNEALGTGNIPDSLLNKEYDLKIDIAFYEKLIHEAKQQKQVVDPKKVKGFENNRFNLKEAYQKLIDGFEHDYPEYHALKFKRENVNITAIQKQLKNTALIEFFVGLDHIFMFTITDQSISCERIVKGVNFEKDIKKLRAIISSEPMSKTVMNALEEFTLLSHQQYKKLLATTCSQLPPQTKQLIIVPDDLLAYLPFSILLEQIDSSNPSYKKLPYLFKKFGINYNYSAALWLKHLDKNLEAPEKEFLGFAPDFIHYTGTDPLSPLSCNIEEVEQIGSSFNTNDLHLQNDATLEGFKNNAADYQIIHLATHATLDNENSAFNRIYFSDNYLSQNDLYQLKLNASLVVLSACNTGSGALKKGEGVLSLTRGFIHAGSQSVLMSLWSVDDCATADIMLNYYKELKRGKPKEQALQLAKINYLDQTNDILQAHPYYWAAFVQYGDTTPINLDTSRVYPLLLGGCFVLISLIFFFFRQTKR